MQKLSYLFILVLLMSLGYANSEKIQENARDFLEQYTQQYQKLYYNAAKAEWKSNTFIVEGDTATAAATQRANEALANFTGSRENIEKAKRFLEHREQLSDLQIKQLELILYEAANNPQTVPELVKKRIKAENEQNTKLYGYDFKIEGKSVTTNEIDSILKASSELEQRLDAWQTSKAVGKVLKDGLTQLQNLRNKTVQALGYSDYFSYQVSDFGMETPDMLAICRRFVKEIWPLYRQLHTYARYELAKKYGIDEVPDYLPAHWLPNRWGQDWNAMITVEGFDLDGALNDKSAQWVMKQGEQFYKSIGFELLPQSFWEKSSLYPLPPEADYKKNNHASAWHLDLDDDVRCLMSVVPNADWYETVHHELGHIYYYISYTNPNVPLLLRRGANRAYHEAVGSLLGLAAMQKPFLVAIELIPASAETNQIQLLLKQALNYIVFIPWGAGVMTEFEHELYAKELPEEQFNQRWWELKKEYQGIVPPNDRGEEYCDAASKTHINNDAAQYYDYALSYIQLFQMHDHIAREILQQDPRSTNYYGSREAGEFLRGILEEGASVDWRTLLREKIGEELSAKAMLNYFSPLMEYLKEANKGREHTL